MGVCTESPFAAQNLVYILDELALESTLKLHLEQSVDALYRDVSQSANVNL
jgi:hypothetical protein